ncbi:hypothetical protein JDV02_001993 [Purpureocillium takamizusanense]|uniref:Uncharacterized protein n=1 Tax=Purpureocillium takamizusanense TaxID=2060973 RepID=A0A9Q8Q9G1_9HYPO|nr:uncharacterized protein JDV02_001993 [Purpureocillium takamizusanense]UNI15460.1 hypothetical protein JDV02_001993 [Purpureocillium takamizusanense]
MNEWPLSKSVLRQRPAVLGGPKRSQLHYVIPATSPNDLFCAVVASALANRYPVPFVIGWKGEGEFDAKAAHIAKIRTIKRYLDTLPNGGEDDDLIMVGDGLDVIAQLPVEIMIERYFQLVSDADARLADRFGISVEEAHSRGLRQTLVWGADKMCWPPLYEEAQCSAIPASNLAHNALGPKTGNGDFVYADPKFLNSGSVIGPLGDLRNFINAGIAEMEATFDPEFEYHNSDQVYLARLFGRQELSRDQRVIRAHNSDVLGSHSNTDFESSNATEHHVTIDYESALFQTGCYFDRWMHDLDFNNSDNTATVSEDVFDQGETFKPYLVQMPANVYQSLLRIYNSIAGHQSLSAQEWIGSLKLATNVVSKNIFGSYHATCNKRRLLDRFRSFWFHPFIQPLMTAAFRDTHTGQLITEKLINGREWVYKTSYPADASSTDQLGGVFTDFEAESFISYTTLCSQHLNIFNQTH